MPNTLTKCTNRHKTLKIKETDGKIYQMSLKNFCRKNSTKIIFECYRNDI